MPSEAQRNLIIGVDIGGTFTDLVIGEEDGETTHRVKTLTTPSDPVEGVMTALREGLELASADAGQVRRFVHATTLTTNLVLERKGSRVAYVSTAGFGDLFAIGKRVPGGSSVFDLMHVRNPPFVAGDMVFELEERMGPDGRPLLPLTTRAAHDAAAKIAAAKPEAVAVCLLHAYANGEHERAFAEVLREYLPDVYLALSSNVWPEMQEYERGATTLISAYIGPTLAGYLDKLGNQLRGAGVTCPLQIMQSSGGIMAAGDAAARAAYTLESGPAAGVIASARLGEHCGYRNLVSFDMGGTTAKAGLVEDGKPRITHDFRVGASASAAHGRGSGEPIRLPTIDLAEVGAGGGSIASVDVGGFLRVGPESAGASPGPVCYGLGGVAPTVTDANLVLGYLDPNYFLGGRMTLDAELAHAAIRTAVAQPLGLDVAEAAWRIHAIANTAMGAAVRMVTVQRGIDPREAVLIAFGGAGPLHCVRLAEEFSIPTVLIPPLPGVRSAFGLLQSDVSYDFITTARTSASDPDLVLLNEAFASLEQRARRDAVAENLDLQRSLEIRFTHQGLRLRIKIPPHEVTRQTIEQAVADFRLEYLRMSGIESADSCQIMNGWLEAVMVVAKPRPPRAREAVDSAARALKHIRPVYFRESGGYVSTNIYDRAALLMGDEILGPALVDEPESTTVLPPGYRLSVDRHLNLLIVRAD